jgi:adenylylsulfate kinase
LPSSGKSTLAQRLRARLEERGVASVVLDSDEMREALSPHAGYSDEERNALYEALARLAATFARQGLIAIVAATSHRAMFRKRARDIAPRFVEVHVRTPLEECIRRDVKNLYRLSREGKAPNLPGLAVEYEAPEAPEITAEGGFDAAALDRLLLLLGG